MRNSSLGQFILVSSKGNTQAEGWRFRLSFAVCLWALVLYGCSRAPTESNVKADLEHYLDQARAWVAAEEQANAAIMKARADQFVHEDIVVGTLRPAINIVQKHIQTLEQYEPRTPSLTSLHQQYVKAWRTYPPAMTAVVDAMEKKDYVRLATAKDELMAAQNAVGMALNGLAGLMEETGLRQKPTPAEAEGTEETKDGIQKGPAAEPQAEAPAYDPPEP